MATQKKDTKKKIKTHKAKGHVISIKLRSQKRRGEQAYYDMVAYLFLQKLRKSVGGQDMMLMSTQQEKRVKTKRILYGKFVKYTKLDGKDWFDDVELSYSSVETPENKNPNPREVEYVFVPATHRFFIAKSSKVSWQAVAKYLSTALKDAINDGEQIEVDVDRDKGDYEKIYNAQIVDWVEINISYTNDDTNAAAAAAIDKQLKKIKAGKAKLRFESDANNDLDITQPLVKGAIDLSKSNGYTKARIKNKKYETVDTSRHAGTFIVEHKDDEVKENRIAEDLINNKLEEE